VAAGHHSQFNHMDWLKGIPKEELFLLNCFDLFGLSKHLNLDEDLLENRYIQLTQKAHPDRNKENQDWAMVLTARINQAYEELMDFRLRAEAFFRLIDSHMGTNNKTMPEGFLQKVFIWNERQEEGNLDFDEVEECYDEFRLFLINESIKPEVDQKEFRMKLNGLKYLENLMNEEDV